MLIPHSKPFTGEEEIRAAERVLRSGRLVQGAEVTAFEEECAERIGRSHAVAVSSGTAALHLALVLLNVKDNDTILTPAYACAALLQPTLWQRAIPSLIDAGPDFNAQWASAPNEACCAIVAHLFGAPSAFPEGAYPVIEDIAQSIGGATGRQGLLTVASFYATKLLTTGEGGMLLTDDSALAEEARDRRDYDNRDDLKLRFAYKMTDLQAAIGRVQLSRLSTFVEERQTIAQQYRQAWEGLPLTLPREQDHIFFRYVLQTPERAALEQFLQQAGIDAKRPVYRPLHHYIEAACPQAEHLHQTALSIPIYPFMTAKEIQHVVQSVQQFFDGAKSQDAPHDNTLTSSKTPGN